MADLSASAAHAIGSKWAAAWSQEEPSGWTDVYTPDAVYTDYAFNFIRRGHQGLEEHFKLWKGSISDFQCSVTEAWPGNELPNGRVKYTVRTKNVGTFTNDLRAMKASGKKFVFIAVVDLVVRLDDGLIERIDEWYHRQFDAELVERDAR